ncbi:MAG: hypothetical protein ABSG69_07390 [Candidatus Acidiferrum sp.]
MPFRSLKKSIYIAGVIFLAALSSRVISAQESVPASSTAAPSAPVAKPTPVARKTPLDTHHFWDKENDWLFAGVAASRTLDYFSTLNFRRRGRQEELLTNNLVDNHAAFAFVEAGGTGLSIGLSYVFYHYGHHKLERYTSIVHMGLATAGAVRNYSLKTAHPASSAASLRVPADFGLGLP